MSSDSLIQSDSINAISTVDSLNSNTSKDSTISKKDIDNINLKKKDNGHTYTGKVVYYGPGFYGKKTSSGQVYDKNKMTAANLGFRVKLGTRVKVTNTKNGKSVVVVVNDNGSHNPKVLLDLSEGAFKKISSDGTLKAGALYAKIEVLK